MCGNVCTNRCGECFFQGRSTGTCDYIFVMGIRRPCLPGRDCTVYLKRKEGEEILRKPQWDTEAGRKMWLEGKSDQQIAEALGTTKAAVQLYRCKKWVPTLKEVLGIPEALPKVAPKAQQEPTKRTRSTASEEQTCDDSEDATEEETKRGGGQSLSQPDRLTAPFTQGSHEEYKSSEEGGMLQKYQLIGRINRAIGFIEGISFSIDADKGDMLRNALEEIEETVSELAEGTYEKR